MHFSGEEGKSIFFFFIHHNLILFLNTDGYAPPYLSCRHGRLRLQPDERPQDGGLRGERRPSGALNHHHWIRPLDPARRDNSTEQVGSTHHPARFHEDLFDSIDANSLIVFDVRNADALVTSTVHAIRTGAMKPMGVLPISPLRPGQVMHGLPWVPTRGRGAKRGLKRLQTRGRGSSRGGCGSEPSKFLAGGRTPGNLIWQAKS